MNTKSKSRKKSTHKGSAKPPYFVDMTSDRINTAPEQCAHKYYTEGLMTGILIGWGITLTSLLIIDMIKNPIR